MCQFNVYSLVLKIDIIPNQMLMIEIIRYKFLFILIPKYSIKLKYYFSYFQSDVNMKIFTLDNCCKMVIYHRS